MAKDKDDKIQQLADEVHNVKTLTYINLTILVILLAFVVGIVLKQLGI